eukprot:4127502-Amphidinium_carterae.2
MQSRREQPPCAKYTSCGTLVRAQRAEKVSDHKHLPEEVSSARHAGMILTELSDGPRMSDCARACSL